MWVRIKRVTDDWALVQIYPFHRWLLRCRVKAVCDAHDRAIMGVEP